MLVASTELDGGLLRVFFFFFLNRLLTWLTHHCKHVQQNAMLVQFIFEATTIASKKQRVTKPAVMALAEECLKCPVY